MAVGHSPAGVIEERVTARISYTATYKGAWFMAMRLRRAAAHGPFAGMLQGTAEDSACMRHDTISHGKDEYVRGEVHTNTVEGFFSLLKRGVNGIYHHVSREHLARYCDEFVFHYENRRASDSERAKMLVAKAEGKRLTYKQPARANA